MRFSSRAPVVAALAFSCFLGGTVWPPCLQSSQATNTMVTAEVIRPYNLDYLDADTMKYYLEAPKADYDLAVLFYAQWCKNCHTFAPYWDQIAKQMHAGSKASGIIMALFDCEQDAQHMEVCNMAGVTHYPTITFYSLSGQTFRRAKRKTKRNPYPLPQHGVPFQGNWQYYQAVHDWLRSMLGLSSWHRAGWGRKLRSLFSGSKAASQQEKALPLGIPGGGGVGDASVGSGGATGAAATTTGSSSDSAAVALLEAKVVNAEEIALRSNTMLGSLLHPTTARSHTCARVKEDPTLVERTRRSDHGKNYTDVFVFLNHTGGWVKDTAVGKDTSSPSLAENEDLVLRSCVMELSLDYCTRVSTQSTLDWIDRHEDSLNDEQTLANLEADLLRDVETQEPYCVLIESCIAQDMVSDECRPPTCPFVDPAACRYVSSCFEGELQRAYADALQVSTTATQLAEAEAANVEALANALKDTDTSTSASGADATTTKVGGGGWGF